MIKYKDVITIIHDWIVDLYKVDETDIEHKMECYEDAFLVHYCTGDFKICVSSLIDNGIYISIYDEPFAIIEENGNVIREENFECRGVIKTYAVETLIKRLKYPPTEEFKKFCAGVKEWISHLTDVTVTEYWYQQTEKSFGKCYVVKMGNIENRFRIETSKLYNLVLSINWFSVMSYLDNDIHYISTEPVEPFTREEMRALKDTILKSMNTTEVYNTNIKRIYDCMKMWFDKMLFANGAHTNGSWTVDSESGYCSFDDKVYKTLIDFGINRVENPSIWMYNPTNKIITFDTKNNWEPDMHFGQFHYRFPMCITRISDLMGICVKEFCNIDYEFRNKVFCEVEQWLKFVCNTHKQFKGMKLVDNNIKHIRWSVCINTNGLEASILMTWDNSHYNISWVDPYSTIKLFSVYPEGAVYVGSHIDINRCDPIYRSLYDRLKSLFVKGEPDSTDEDLLASIGKQLHKFPQKIEVVKSRPNFKTWAGMFSYRPIDEIRKDFKEAVNGFKPETLYIDKIFAADTINIEKKEGKGMRIPNIKHVLFNETKKVTTVLFVDGTRVTSKATPDDEFDPEVGFAMCIMKKLYGDRTKFQKKIKEYQKMGERRNKKIKEKVDRKANKESTVKSSS